MKVFMPLVFALLTSQDAFAVKEIAQFGGCLNTTLLAEEVVSCELRVHDVCSYVVYEYLIHLSR